MDLHGKSAVPGAWRGSCGFRSQTLHTHNTIKNVDQQTGRQTDSARQLTHGMGVFCTMCFVSSLNFLQKSIMLMPSGPKAWPIAGPGFAVPAGTRILTVRTNDMFSSRPLSSVMRSQGSSSCARQSTRRFRCTPLTFYALEAVVKPSNALQGTEICGLCALGF